MSRIQRTAKVAQKAVQDHDYIAIGTEGNKNKPLIGDFGFLQFGLI